MTKHPAPDRTLYLGYRGTDHDVPWARFLDPAIAPLLPAVAEAATIGPVAAPLLGRLEDAGQLVDRDDQIEDGLAVDEDGSIVVAVRTPMPGVTPAMWDWWFGWHGSDPTRYKLWHPRAHLSALWGDGDDRGRTGRDRYVGRTSFVDEYLGSTLANVTIRFVPPGELGFDETRLTDRTAICARTGSSVYPVDIGWLVHLVEPTNDGCTMRSRFWLGGRHTAPKQSNAVLDKLAPPLANRKAALGVQAATDLLVHCSQEMRHLAGFLPALHDAFGDE